MCEIFGRSGCLCEFVQCVDVSLDKPARRLPLKQHVESRKWQAVRGQLLHALSVASGQYTLCLSQVGSIRFVCRKWAVYALSVLRPCLS
jgi:hypothetical protein